MKHRIAWQFTIFLSASVIIGCGRPESGGGGPPGDFTVSAVVAPAALETVESTIQLVGSLKARDAIDVVSQINELVAEVLFTDGQTVDQGQVLVRLDDAKIAARLREAKARFQLAKTNYDRSSELHRSQTISRQEFDQSEAEYHVAEAVYKLLSSELTDTVISAPFPGVVSERLVSAGEYLPAGQTITRLIRMDPLEVEFRVPERHVSRLQAGQQIVMKNTAFSSDPITGEIFFIDPVINENTRTVLAKALIANPDHRLKPGLFGALDVVLEVRENTIVIPESAVRYAGDQASVVVMNGDDRAEFRDVKVGQRLPGKVEIIEGLTGGERVVVEGYQKMGPGTGIQISPSSEKYGITPPPLTES